MRVSACFRYGRSALGGRGPAYFWAVAVRTTAKASGKNRRSIAVRIYLKPKLRPGSSLSRGRSSIMIKVITQTVSESRAAKAIWGAFQSGRPLTYIRTVEEQRVARVLREVALGLFASPVPIWTWSLTEGLRRENEAAEAGTLAPRQALDFIAAHKGDAIFHLKDFHEPLRESAEIRRRLRDVYENCLDQRKFVVVTS